MKIKYVANLSFGKDSLCMCLKLIDLGYPLDEIIFFSTGMDFPCIDEMVKKFSDYCVEKGVKFTVIEPDKPFEWYMTEKLVTKRDGSIQKGYGFCSNKCRFGTGLKIQAINRYYKSYGDVCIVQYIGCCIDEQKRLRHERSKNTVNLYPLAEWGMTEADCLKFCREKGWNWMVGDVDLYDILDRVSCWCCGNKNLKELRAIYKYLPETFEKLKILQDKIGMPFRDGKTVYDLEERFKLEESQMTIWDMVSKGAV